MILCSTFHFDPLKGSNMISFRAFKSCVKSSMIFELVSAVLGSQLTASLLIQPDCCPPASSESRHRSSTYSELDGQGVLNWIGRPGPGLQPFEFEARLYDTLFSGEDPGKLGDDWVQDVNPASRIVVPGAYGNPLLASAPVSGRQATCSRLPIWPLCSMCREHLQRLRGLPSAFHY